MKSFLQPAYTFVPGASGVGTLNLSAISSFSMKRLVAVINQTSGIVIYSTASVSKRATEAAGVLTLQFDTSAMNAGDRLQVIYEDMGQASSANSSPVVLSTAQELILDDTKIAAEAAIVELQAIGAQITSLINEVTVVQDGLAFIEENQDDVTSIFDGVMTAKGINTAFKADLGATIDAGSNAVRGGAGDAVSPLVDEYGVVVVWDTYNEAIFTSTNGLINSMNNKFGTLGRKASAGSQPVVLSTEQEAILSAAATATKQDDTNTKLDALISKDFATTAKQDLLLAELQQKADLSETQPVSAASLPLPTGAATSAKQDLLLTELQLKADLTETQPVSQQALTGSYQEDITVTDGSVETITAPGGAKWCKIQADEANTGNMRVKIGAAATTTSGIQFQPGRSEDYMIAGNISYTMEAGATGKIYVQFGV